MPEKASFRESRRACRGHCTSKRRKPSDTTGVVVAHTSWSQLAPVLGRAFALVFARQAGLVRVPSSSVVIVAASPHLRAIGLACTRVLPPGAFRWHPLI